jgi:tetratricopeptide (TPR) repeat protein/tRNA A-37 threonylcarbamoyl transferase component Bud32
VADIAVQLGEALRDRYLLERKLGQGGMATVYLARDIKHDRLVALKVLHPELATSLGPERFQREVRTVARLQHPHILTVLDSGEASGQLWFTMPYVEGESLRDRLRREGQLPVEDAVRIAIEAARGLDCAHQHGIVHRDVKPENILLTNDGSTLVADFGLARALGDAEDQLTQTGMVLGTPVYMSPEQASGGLVDARTDVYALGCVFYEMLAGEPPFTGSTPLAITAKRLAGEAPRVRLLRSAVPPAIDAAVARALAPVPADRFGSMADLVRALGEHAHAPAPVVPAASHRRRRLATIGFVLAGLLATAGIVVAARELIPGESLVRAGTLARSDELVLADFANHANDSSLATAITEAFRVDFAQSRLVRLASPGRVRGALRRMQRDETAALTAETGRELALREGIKAVLAGEVTRLGSGYVLSASLVSADSGRVLAAGRETAVTAAEIIPAVDRLSAHLRRRIGESLRKVRSGSPLEVVTTGSLDALRRYSLGVRAHEAGRWEEALTYYEDASRIDTTFAMAWRGIAVILWNMQRNFGRQDEALTRAYALRDRLTERERYETEGLYADGVLDDQARARAAYRSLLALDSTDTGALVGLGLIAWTERDLEEAETMASRAIRADSNALAPYTNVVDAQVSGGRFAAAETSLARWRTRLGESPVYESQVGLMASARGQYDSAARAFRRAVGMKENDAERARAGNLLAALALARGRLREARRLGREAAELDGSPAAALGPALHETWGDIYLGLGPERASRRLDSLVESPGFARVDPIDRPYQEIGFLYAMAGKDGRASALRRGAEGTLRRVGSAGEQVLRRRQWRMGDWAREGATALRSERYAEAAERFRKARTVAPQWWLPELATAYDRAGQADSALALYESYLNSTDNFRLYGDAFNLAPILRRAGELYEARSDRDRAVSSYQRFLDLWRDADPELQPQVVEVRRRLAALTAERPSR